MLWHVTQRSTADCKITYMSWTVNVKTVTVNISHISLSKIFRYHLELIISLHTIHDTLQIFRYMCPPAIKLKVSAFHLVITYLDIFLTIQRVCLFLTLKKFKIHSKLWCIFSLVFHAQFLVREYSWIQNNSGELRLKSVVWIIEINIQVEV